MSALLPGLLVGLLLCMFLVDSVQVLLRALSALVGAPVLGAHLGSVFMLINRAATALALLTIGYMIDTHVQASTLLLIYAAGSLVIAVSHLPLLVTSPILRMTVRAFKSFYGKVCTPEQLAGAKEALVKPSPWKVSYPVVLVTTIGFLGLLVPSLAASTFPQYRATLMQTGFIINSMASIINVFQVERKIAMTIDQGDPGSITALYCSFTHSRTLGYSLAMVAFAVPAMVLHA